MLPDLLPRCACHSHVQDLIARVSRLHAAVAGNRVPKEKVQSWFPPAQPATGLRFLQFQQLHVSEAREMRKYRTNTAQQITKRAALRPFLNHVIIDSHRPSWQAITPTSTVYIHHIIGYINTFGTKELVLVRSVLWYRKTVC